MKKGIWSALAAGIILVNGPAWAQGEINPSVASEPREAEEKKVFSFVEQMPEFPGGSSGLMNYLSKNLRYPESALNAEIQGRVYVKFVVCTDGSLCDEEIVRGVDTALNEEVLRVVRAMPRWKPGTQNGKAVKTYYTLPVTFML